MKTTDPRDMTWEEIRSRLDGARVEIWQWLRYHGAATTSAIAEGTEIPLLTVRPRVCELAALGWVECIGRENREGVYQAVEVDTLIARRAEATREAQLPLKLS
jgi:sugar-specific transcriptional regulator TrmB